MKEENEIHALKYWSIIKIIVYIMDFDRGDTIQLTGTATILWNAEWSQFAGAERLVEFQIEKVIVTTNATLMRWRFREYSPYLPN